jgi:large subunit ribosomal protein L21
MERRKAARRSSKRDESRLGRGSERENPMYAVVRTGGKQYRVAAGDSVEVEKLEGDIGSTVTLNDVLLIADGDNVSVGQPNVDGASVTAKITGQYRGDKILVFRYRPKKRIRVRRGHRQYLTRLQIEAITA